jgi:alpha-galactosidase
MQEWGFQGLKIDGQHLNGVAPFQSGASPRAPEGREKLQDFRAIYATGTQVRPEVVMEPPCGTSYSFYNWPANQAPASTPNLLAGAPQGQDPRPHGPERGRRDHGS